MTTARGAGTTRALAEFAVDFTLHYCPGTAVAHAKRCVLDAFGCALGGSRTALARAALDATLRLGAASGPATLVGFGQTAAVDRAAFVNGVSANALDYDDGILLQGHYSSTIIPAALAMGQLTGAAGRAFLEAVIAGYEVVVRIGNAVRPTPDQRRLVAGHGTHQGFGAAVAAGRLAGLDAAGMTEAIGLCGAFAPVPNVRVWNWEERPLAWYKDTVHWPALVGINAVMLAASGFRGPRRVLEGEQSFWRMANSDRFAPEALTDGIGTRFQIEDVYFKPYPSCRWNHAAIDALRQILARRDWSADDVATIEAGVPEIMIEGGFADMGRASIVDAEFSLPYALAMVLRGVTAGPDWYRAENLESEAVAEIMERVRLDAAPEMECLYREKRAVGTSLRVTSRDGTVDTERIDHALGSRERPVSDAELKMKYDTLATSVLTEPEAERLATLIMDLERVQRIDELAAVASGGAAS